MRIQHGQTWARLGGFRCCEKEGKLAAENPSMSRNGWPEESEETLQLPSIGRWANCVKRWRAHSTLTPMQNASHVLLNESQLYCHVGLNFFFLGHCHLLLACIARIQQDFPCPPKARNTSRTKHPDAGEERSSTRNGKGEVSSSIQARAEIADTDQVIRTSYRWRDRCILSGGL